MRTHMSYFLRMLHTYQNIRYITRAGFILIKIIQTNSMRKTTVECE